MSVESFAHPQKVYLTVKPITAGSLSIFLAETDVVEKEAEAQEAATAALVPEEYVYDLYYRDNREQGITTGAGEVGAL